MRVSSRSLCLADGRTTSTSLQLAECLFPSKFNFRDRGRTRNSWSCTPLTGIGLEMKILPSHRTPERKDLYRVLGFPGRDSGLYCSVHRAGELSVCGDTGFRWLSNRAKLTISAVHPVPCSYCGNCPDDTKTNIVGAVSVCRAKPGEKCLMSTRHPSDKPHLDRGLAVSKAPLLERFESCGATPLTNAGPL